MGKQSCAVMLGFVSLHVAAIMAIVSLSTNEWVDAHANGTSIKANKTNHCDVGLWKSCCYMEECVKHNASSTTSTMKATEALSVVGMGFLVVAIFFTYIFLFGDKMKTSVFCAGFIACDVIVGAAALLSAVIVFGLRYDELNGYPHGYLVHLGWSYYVEVAATVFAWISALTSTWSYCIMRNRPVGYEDI